jgi:hypothetical protein
VRGLATSLPATTLGPGVKMLEARSVDAEPILLQGYEGMKAREGKIPAPYKKRIGEAAASIVSLYDACGKKELADQWRRRLETPAQKAAPGR